MNGGGRLSAAEKGKQKVAADADAADADLPPAPALVLDSAGGEPRRLAAVDAAANCEHAASAGVRRRLFPDPPSGGTSEIEEAPPSPPDPAPPSRPHLPALDAADEAGLAAVAGLDGTLLELQCRLRELEQRRREERDGDEGSKGEEANKLQRQLGTVRAKVSGVKDAMLAFRLMAEEMQASEDFWVPLRQPPQCQRNNSKAELEQMKALEEFWKPVVPVSQRNNNKRKINWEQIVSLIALTSGLVPYILIFWTRLPVNNDLTHIVGAISVLWILRSTYSSCCQRFRTSRTISRHVPRLIYVCFWLLNLYVLNLIFRLIHGAFAGLLGEHQ